MDVERRRAVSSASLAAVGLSGCFGVGMGDGTTDISISNETAEERTATIRVTKRSEGTQLLDETFVIGANAKREHDEVVSGVRVNVHPDVENGPEDAFEGSDGDSDAQSLFIGITTDSIEFTPAVE